jgi:hypothetical protein
VITAAAAVMVAVFASFAAGDDRVLKLFGVAMATAVFLDAVVIRSILMPAVLELFGRYTWAFPGGRTAGCRGSRSSRRPSRSRLDEPPDHACRRAAPRTISDGPVPRSACSRLLSWFVVSASSNSDAGERSCSSSRRAVLPPAPRSGESLLRAALTGVAADGRTCDHRASSSHLRDRPSTARKW